MQNNCGKETKFLVWSLTFFWVKLEYTELIGFFFHNDLSITQLNHIVQNTNKQEKNPNATEGI